jgi:cell division protein FtsB
VADFTNSQRSLSEAQDKNNNLVQQVERLKSLVENLDQNKEELIKRL